MPKCFFQCFFMALLASANLLEAAEPTQVVATAKMMVPRQPQVAVDERNSIYITFGASGAVYFCKSTDGGKSYSTPVQVAEVKRLALGMRRGPRIAISNQALVISAISHDSGNLLSWRSTDQGKTWSGDVVVNGPAGAAREGLHAMAAGPNGALYCTWLDLRQKGTQIYGASSGDGGETWSENRLIYTSPSGSVCECCHPSVTFDSQGAITVMWRNALDGNRDMYLATSNDGGKNFEPAEKLGVGTWPLKACPMDGGQLASLSPGKFITVWRRDNQLFQFTTGERAESLLGMGVQPWVTTNSVGAWLTWVSKRNGELWLAAPTEKQPRKLFESANDPVLAPSPSGKGPVVIVWETGDNRNSRIMALVLTK